MPMTVNGCDIENPVKTGIIHKYLLAKKRKGSVSIAVFNLSWQNCFVYPPNLSIKLAISQPIMTGVKPLASIQIPSLFTMSLNPANILFLKGQSMHCIRVQRIQLMPSSAICDLKSSSKMISSFTKLSLSILEESLKLNSIEDSF